MEFPRLVYAAIALLPDLPNHEIHRGSFFFLKVGFTKSYMLTNEEMMPMVSSKEVGCRCNLGAYAESCCQRMKRWVPVSKFLIHMGQK